MKILHVITALDSGGAERVLADLCLAEQAAGSAPVVAVLVGGGLQEERLRAAGIRVEHLRMTRGRPSLPGLLRLVRLIRGEQPDIVQSWMYHADLCTFLALLLSGRRRYTGLIWGLRCSDMKLSEYDFVLRASIRLCAWLSRFPDRIVVNSRAGMTVHQRIGYDPRRMVLIDNGFDTARFRPDPEARKTVRRELGIGESDFVIGSVARVDVMKDYPTLLAALSDLQDTTCLAIGKATERLPAVPGLLRLGERKDLPRLLNALDVVVSASAFGEGVSNALGEAMATGIPVVATDVGDARRLVGEAGVVVPPRSPEALAEAVASLRDDPARCRELGQRARQRIAVRFTFADSRAAYRTLHRELVPESQARMSPEHV